jgi:M6 family metalloprotease-like protein
MRRTALISILVVALLSSTLANAATPVAGKPCNSQGQTQIYKANKFTCIKSGKKLIWSAPVAITPAAAKPSPSPSASPSASPTTTPTATTTSKATSYGVVSAPVKGINVYTGGPGGRPSNLEVSFELPVPVQVAPAGTNVKLWIYNPSDKKTKAGSGGVWLQISGGEWKFYPANVDGSFYANLIPGYYLFDIVEPNPTQYVRKRYSAAINSSGVFTMSAMRANSAGFFTVTVDLPSAASSNKYVPTTQCQLLDQTNNLQMEVGFPKAAGRLPSFGTIRALIIPVDFADVVGQRPPAEEFTPMTDGMNDFYYKMSGNKVKFDYQVLKNWVRMPVSSTFHKLGVWGQGDSWAYWKLAVETADPLVDYSQFDVVYVLSPREIPWSSIAYGPAGPLGTSGISTDDGPITNITLSGADAWQNLASGSAWRWISHETGHLFGLHDLYVSPGSAVYGTWDLMSNNWSTGAIELNTWNRYLLGWLTDSQINCLNSADINSTGVTQLINPIERINDVTKAVVVRLSSSKILVIESRRNEGLDVLTSSQEGSLVYTVDMTIQSIKGGWQVQRRQGSTNPEFTDAALHLGDVITVEGLRIEVVGHDQNGDTVKVSKA